MKTDVLGILRERCPGIPPTAGNDFDITRDGLLDHVQRTALLHAALDIAPKADPRALRLARTLGELADLVSGLRDAVPGDTHLQPGSYSTARIYLRPISQADYVPFYEAAIGPEHAFRWRFRGRTPPFEDFVSTLYKGVLASFSVASRFDDSLIGLVSAYDPSFEAGHCKFALQRIEQKGSSQEPGLMIEALGTFVTYLFRHWPLRKVYAEIPSFTMDFLGGFAGGVDSVEGRVLQREATLTDYIYFDDRLHDIHIYSISRERWFALVETLGIPRHLDIP